VPVADQDQLTLQGVSNFTREIRERLRDQILSGNYEAGDRLPSEREICVELRANRRAVRSALELLEREGLVIRRPNCRPIVGAIDESAPEEPPLTGGQKLSNFVALMMWHADPREEDRSGRERIFWGMNQTLGRAHYHTVFIDLGEPIGQAADEPSQEAAHLQYALNQGFAGVVFYCCTHDANIELMRKVNRQVPLILIDRKVYGIEADYVGIANREGTYEATRYLQKLGHRRIAYLTFNESLNTVQDRLRGYLEAMAELDRSEYYELVLPMPSGLADRWPVAESIFGLPADQRPTAVVCVNDFQAVAMQKRLEAMGLDVPGDISLIGCDDLIVRLPNGVGLTTIAQPFEEIGAEAAALFLRQAHSRKTVSRKPDCVNVECRTKLVVRQSCKSLLAVD